MKTKKASKLIDENEYVEFLVGAMGILINVYLPRYFACEKITGTITVPWYWCCRILLLSILITIITFMTIIPT